MLKLTQGQKLSQKLLPMIVLNQNILAIPSIALDNIIKKELELNPMLEEGSDSEPEESDQQLNSEAEESNTDSQPDSIENKIDEEYDWDEYFENEQSENISYGGGSNPDKETVYVLEDHTSVNDGRLLQLNLSELNGKLKFISEEIIGSLNGDGYFTVSADDILKDIDVKKIGTEYEDSIFTKEDVEEALIFIQKILDPPGICARNLNECMLIQIDRSDKNETLKAMAKSVVENNFDDLRLKRFENISRNLNLKMDDVKEIIEFIHKLNPKPGQPDTLTDRDYIIPDVVVKKIDDKYEIFLNERFIPSLRINRTYREMYTNDKKNLDKDTKDYLVNNFNRAKWFIDAINSRRETILKISEAIIKRQKEFFDNNGEGLKPLYEKDVAEDIRMDTSTVSRAVRGKYMQTDFGIYELRSFFTTPLSMKDGDDVSNIEAKIRLKKLIDEEDKNKPLTDEELASEMCKLGFKIARRTVAKYREAINIPVAKQRREILNNLK